MPDAFSAWVYISKSIQPVSGNRSFSFETGDSDDQYAHRATEEKIQQDSLLIEKVMQTIPGAVYVFDIELHKGIYSNHKLGDIIGYNHGELNALGDMAVYTLLHPEDQEAMIRHLEVLKN